MDTIFDGEVPRARLALLLRHFSELKDNREPWRIVYPLQEVLLLVTCATIASCDDFDDIVAWGKHHLVFLRHFSEYHHGIPCEPKPAVAPDVGRREAEGPAAGEPGGRGGGDSGL